MNGVIATVLENYAKSNSVGFFAKLILWTAGLYLIFHSIWICYTLREKIWLDREKTYTKCRGRMVNETRRGSKNYIQSTEEVQNSMFDHIQLVQYWCDNL